VSEGGLDTTGVVGPQSGQAVFPTESKRPTPFVLPERSLGEGECIAVELGNSASDET
jgi:hypothetical protein